GLRGGDAAPRVQTRPRPTSCSLANTSPSFGGLSPPESPFALDKPPGREGEQVPSTAEARGGYGSTVRSRYWVLCRVEGREGSDGSRRRPTPLHALAVEGRLSNLQGHEGVEGRRSERRGQVPPGRHAPWGHVAIGSLGVQADEHRPLPGRGLFLPFLP